MDFYGATKAILIYPSPGPEKLGLKKLGSIGPTGNNLELSEYFCDLSGNLENEERDLFDKIKDLAN